MFSKNTYLQFPQASSSLHSGRTSTFAVELNGTAAAELFLHHHPELLSGHYLAANAPVLEAAALFHQDSGGPNGDPSSNSNTFPRKPAAAAPSKKDRHSKIYTSQGPRDRRVRLSIGIARKFFDLQEMLGFDKPSKTLDWLLTKSKTAIKDLVQTKTNPNNTISSSPDDEENVDGSDRSVMLNSNKSCSKGTNLAKESRAKARARARERTKEKMNMKQQMNESRNLNKGSSDNHHWNNPSNIGIHSSCGNQYEVSMTGAAASVHYPFVYEGLIQETMKRKGKNLSSSSSSSSSSSVLGFQSNFAVSNENWDYNSFSTSNSSLCAILDQHKFMN